MVRKHIMKHKCTRALIVAILTCSFSLGSVPASVGAWQLSRAIERAQMGYSGNFVSYADEKSDARAEEKAGNADSAAVSGAEDSVVGAHVDDASRREKPAGGGLPKGSLLIAT